MSSRLKRMWRYFNPTHAPVSAEEKAAARAELDKGGGWGYWAAANVLGMGNRYRKRRKELRAIANAPVRSVRTPSPLQPPMGFDEKKGGYPPSKRRRYSGAAPSRNNLGMTAILEALSGGSKRYLDTTQGAYDGVTQPIADDIPESSRLVQVNAVPMGNDTSKRVGKNIKMLSLQIRGQLVPQASMPVTHHAVMVVIYDRSPGATMPTISEIFDSDSPASFTKDTNSARFQILARRAYAVSPYDNTNNQVNGLSSNIYVNEFVKVNRKTIYKGAASGTGVPSDIDEGGLYVYWVSQGANTGSTGCAIGMNYRLRFVDFIG